jgi:hypothetical protein
MGSPPPSPCQCKWLWGEAGCQTMPECCGSHAKCGQQCTLMTAAEESKEPHIGYRSCKAPHQTDIVLLNSSRALAAPPPTHNVAAQPAHCLLATHSGMFMPCKAAY